MQEAYVEWLYDAMVHADHDEFACALEHAASALGESRTREAFVEAHDMFLVN